MVVVWVQLQRRIHLYRRARTVTDAEAVMKMTNGLIHDVAQILYWIPVEVAALKESVIYATTKHTKSIPPKLDVPKNSLLMQLVPMQKLKVVHVVWKLRIMQCARLPHVVLV